MPSGGKSAKAIGARADAWRKRIGNERGANATAPGRKVAVCPLHVEQRDAGAHVLDQRRHCIERIEDFLPYRIARKIRSSDAYDHCSLLRSPLTTNGVKEFLNLCLRRSAC